MSENIDLINIIAPTLDGSYGEKVTEVFKNIDNNFQKLSNHDFIKGNDGSSVQIEEVDLKDGSDNSNNIIESIKTTIYNNFNGKGLEDIIYNGSVIRWYDNLYMNPGKILLMYKDDKILSSFPYIHIDPRFSDKLSDMSKENDYSNTIDTSCVLYYDISSPTNFKVVELFPTLYYDEDSLNFCWKVWGNQTGLIANGPKGESGENGNISIVMRDYSSKNDTNSVFRVKKIMINGEFKDVKDITDSDKYIGFPAIVYFDSENLSDTNRNKFWMSNIIKDNDNLTVVCSSYNVIENKFNSSELFNTLLDINPYNIGTSGNFAKGIFLPIGAAPNQAPSDQRAHILYNEHVSKTGYTDKNNRTKLVLSSVENVGDANSSNKYPGAPGIVWPNEVSDSEFEVRMKTDFTKPTSIRPLIQGASNNALSIDSEEFKIQLGGTWYKLSIDEGGNLKGTITSAPLSE